MTLLIVCCATSLESLHLYKNLRVDHSTGDNVIGGRGTSSADVRVDWQQAVAVANVRPAYISELLGEEHGSPCRPPIGISTQIVYKKIRRT